MRALARPRPAAAPDRLAGAARVLADPWVGAASVALLCFAECLRLTLYTRWIVSGDGRVDFSPVYLLVNLEPVMWILPGWFAAAAILWFPLAARRARGADGFWEILGSLGSAFAPFALATLAVCAVGATDASTAASQGAWIGACVASPLLGTALLRRRLELGWLRTGGALLAITGVAAAFNLLVQLLSLHVSGCPVDGVFV